ncbi:uncharacterized protein LOC136072497 isoform X2 [Hydra vulgaris]|uniref:Uncharacterized protein LOC136072497 isoform X2 n=1 Tax=Hydra vulgaris TaxID=6087 RepID=A0ABM4DB86_HYDVU
MFPEVLIRQKTVNNSDRRFHWCYASNKSENLKLRRLSQSIDSCAHMQTLVHKKKERKLITLLESFEREKVRYENEQNNKNIYLQLLKENIDKNGGASKYLLSSNILNVRSDKPKNSSTFCSSVLSKHKYINSQLKRRVAVRQVVPFYLYRDYRFKNHFDLYKKSQTDFSLHCSKNDLNSRSSNLCWLFSNQQKPSWTSRNASKTAASMLNNNGMPSELCNVSVSSLKSLPCSTNNSISLINAQSNLTPIERHELVMYRSGVKSGEDRELTKILNLSQNKSENFTYENSLKLRDILIKNLKKDNASCDNIDELLDSCDEGQVYPAFQPGFEETFEDFRMLRKCKYVRLSKLNWDSLKDVTMERLSRKKK